MTASRYGSRTSLRRHLVYQLCLVTPTARSVMTLVVKALGVQADCLCCSDAYLALTPAKPNL